VKKRIVSQRRKADKNLDMNKKKLDDKKIKATEEQVTLEENKCYSNVEEPIEIIKYVSRTRKTDKNLDADDDVLSDKEIKATEDLDKKVLHKNKKRAPQATKKRTPVSRKKEADKILHIDEDAFDGKEMKAIEEQEKKSLQKNKKRVTQGVKKKRTREADNNLDTDKDTLDDEEIKATKEKDGEALQKDKKRYIQVVKENDFSRSRKYNVDKYFSNVEEPNEIIKASKSRAIVEKDKKRGKISKNIQTTKSPRNEISSIDLNKISDVSEQETISSSRGRKRKIISPSPENSNDITFNKTSSAKRKKLEKNSRSMKSPKRKKSSSDTDKSNLKISSPLSRERKINDDKITLNETLIAKNKNVDKFGLSPNKNQGKEKEKIEVVDIFDFHDEYATTEETIITPLKVKRKSRLSYGHKLK